jgi:hypothetical protein
MKTVEAQLEFISSLAVWQLKSTLKLDGDDVSDERLEQIEEFRKKVMVGFYDDLVDVVESFKSKRSTDGPLSDEESDELNELLQARWYATFTKDIEEFQNSMCVIPRNE